MSIILRPDSIATWTMGGRQLTVNQKIIPDGMRATKDVARWVQRGQLMKPNAPIGPVGRPLAICVHNTNDIRLTTPETNAAEQYTRATFDGNMAGVIVHFYVWRNEIWQNLRLNERGWHAGDGSSRRAGRRPGQQIGGNLDTIAIEAIGSHKETTDTTAALCAWLCQEFGFDPALDIWTHFDFSRKNCPLYIRSHWPRFLKAVKGYLTGEASNAAKTNRPKQRPIEGNRGGLKQGDRVRIIQVGVPYYPSQVAIPKWLEGQTLTVDSSKPMLRGGVMCVRLQPINSWCDKSNLRKVED